MSNLRVPQGNALPLLATWQGVVDFQGRQTDEIKAAQRQELAELRAKHTMQRHGLKDHDEVKDFNYLITHGFNARDAIDLIKASRR